VIQKTDKNVLVMMLELYTSDVSLWYYNSHSFDNSYYVEHLTWFPLPRYEKNNMNKYGNESQHDDFMPTNDLGWTQKFRHVVVSSFEIVSYYLLNNQYENDFLIHQ